MIDPIVQTPGGATVIGGGITSESTLKCAQNVAPVVVAADGGAIRAVDLGVCPLAVIGDMDSLGDVRAGLTGTAIHRVSEQDSTDFEKCLQRIDAGFVIGVGMTGARNDHFLAALNVLARRNRGPVLLLDDHDVIFVLPGEILLDLDPGTRVSLFPLGRWQGTSSGLRWPLDGLTLEPGGQIATSNEATGPVRITGQGGALIAILPARCLPKVLDALIPGDRRLGIVGPRPVRE